MATLRFLSVFIIVFLLLNPMLRTMVTRLEKPIFIVAMDESESIYMTSDSAFIQSRFKPELSQTIERLEDEYEVRTYAFGDRVEEKIGHAYDHKQTNMSQLLEELGTRFTNRNVGGVLFATDGQYNRGSNPAYEVKSLGFPIYPVALGDTTLQKDLVLDKVAHNEVAYLGNQFPLEAVYHGIRIPGASFELSVTHKGKKVYAKQLSINNTGYGTHAFTLEAKEVGLQHYIVRLSAVKDEVTLINNVNHVYVDVLDGRQKVLILAEAPHPDIAALRYAIQTKEEYEVDVELQDDFSGKFDEYNLVVMHQIPSKRMRSDILVQEIRDKEVPIMFVLGKSSAINNFNQLNDMVKVSGSGGRTNDVTAVNVENFPLFQLDKEHWQRFERFPPLQAPFGQFQPAKDMIVAFRQKIGLVRTKSPLIGFKQRNGVKEGYVLGEGMWRWRLAEYKMYGNHDAFDGFATKMVQFLSLKVDKSSFRVRSDNKVFENEPVVFDAQLYDDSYELINEPEVDLIITDTEDKKYEYKLARSGKVYYLDIGRLPVGEYKYLAKTSHGGKDHKERGSFTVQQLNIEQLNASADHRVLYQMAENSGGEVLYSGGLTAWVDALAENENVVTVQHSNEELFELINWKWIFFLIVGLLTAEWFMRKRNGAY